MSQDNQSIEDIARSMGWVKPEGNDPKNEASNKPVDTKWLLTDEDYLHNGKQQATGGIDELQLTETLYNPPQKHKYAPDAWSLAGDLISAGLLPMPNLKNDISKERLDYAITVIEHWLKVHTEG